MRSQRFLLLVLLAGCSSSTTPVSTPTDLGADANDASDDVKSVDVSVTPMGCMCNCDVGPGSGRPRRDDRALVRNPRQRTALRPLLRHLRAF